MANRGLVKSYTAEGAIAPHRLVKFGAADYGVLQGTAGTDKVIGVTVPLITVATGETVDVIRTGIADVEYGGNVTRGDKLMSDANGKAILAAAAVGANVHTIGVAEVSGVAGDIGLALIAPGTFQG